MATHSMVSCHRAYTQGDNYTCIAVANIYIAIVNIHIGLEAPMRFTPYQDGTCCTINLVQYCAPNWKHFRSTRPMSSPPASLGPASADLELAEGGPAGVVRSGKTGVESWGGLQEILLMDDGPASQLSQYGEDIELHQQVQQQHPMRSEELVILDENLFHSPFGSTDPYKFYRLLNVEITASLPQIEAAHNNLSLLYHPDSHDTFKDAWTGQFVFKDAWTAQLCDLLS